MEAHEALIAAALGLSALYAYTRVRDPVDKWLALGVLWICVTGILGLLLAQRDEPFNYVRLALRISGPPVLLLLCEESVRTASNPGNRRTSIIFAVLVWALAVGALVYYEGGPLGGANLVLGDLTFGVTAWMAILGLCFIAALLTIVPAALRGIFPGLAGLVAVILLGSETWAAIDPRWNTGALTFADSVSYRSLLTFALAALAVLKAHQKSWTWLQSGAARDPLEPAPAKSSSGGETGRRGSKPSRSAETGGDDEQPSKDAGPDEEPAEEKPRGSGAPGDQGDADKKSRRSGAPGGQGKAKKKGKKKKKRK